MSALPSISPSATLHALPTARFSRRVITENRALAGDTLWVKFTPDAETGLQNFTPALVAEFQDVLDSLMRTNNSGSEAVPAYTVVQSAHPEYFSVGGDLRFFRQCIETRDASRLRDYSMKCLNLMYTWASRLKAHNTSIALVQGRALGGGFEMALSTDHIIAEERSEFGFPEIMFGLFPCTGAMGLLTSRVGAKQAERMMTSKRVYKARELLEMGVIDEVCADGKGELAVERFVAEHHSRQKARFKIQESRYRNSPLNYEEGVLVVEDWVELAMGLTQQELRNMEMLIMLQKSDSSPKQRMA